MTTFFGIWMGPWTNPQVWHTYAGILIKDSTLGSQPRIKLSNVNMSKAMGQDIWSEVKQQERPDTGFW